MEVNQLDAIKKNLKILENYMGLILNKNITFDFKSIEGATMLFTPKGKLIQSEVSLIISKRIHRSVQEQSENKNSLEIQVFGPEKIECTVEALLEESHELAYYDDEFDQPYVKKTVNLKEISGSFVILNALNEFQFDLIILDDDSPKGKLKVSSSVTENAEKIPEKFEKGQEIKLESVSRTMDVISTGSGSGNKNIPKSRTLKKQSIQVMHPSTGAKIKTLRNKVQKTSEKVQNSSRKGKEPSKKPKPLRIKIQDTSKKFQNSKFKKVVQKSQNAGRKKVPGKVPVHDENVLISYDKESGVRIYQCAGCLQNYKSKQNVQNHAKKCTKLNY